MSVPQPDVDQEHAKKSDHPSVVGQKDANLPLPFKLAGAPTRFHLPTAHPLCVGDTLTPRRLRLWFWFAIHSFSWVYCAYVTLYLHPHQYPWLTILGGMAGANTFSAARSLLSLGGLRKVVTDSEGIELVYRGSTTRVAWMNIQSLERAHSWRGEELKMFTFHSVAIPACGFTTKEFNNLSALIKNRAGLVPSKDKPALYERPTTMLTAPERLAGPKL